MATSPRPRGLSQHSALRPFHPIIQRWFSETLGTPSEPQKRGWPAIATGDHTLILAPTGTGKTLAAFLWELNQLILAGLESPLPNAVQILYVSPLKALNNDIHRNLERPLAELRQRFEQSGIAFPEIRVAVRTGDTPASSRARMLRSAPHILITTPESLNIILTSERARGMFGMVRAVIVDEIHAVAGTKRGAHLALTLERLVVRCARPPQRIGLSATQRPLEELGKFLGGVGESRSVTIVDCGVVKPMRLQIISPVADLGDVSGSIWPKVIDTIHARAREARTMLVFVNNRAQAEKIAARLNLQAEEELAQPYHGSLARERRQALEAALKAGALRVLVATSSLELGIDIGSVDLVVQVQSPKRVASGLQRVGRAGHTLGETSHGIFVPTFRDDLVEICAIVEAMASGEVELTHVPQNALDVLAQTIVAMVSVDDWTAGEVFDLVRRSYPYHRLTRPAFDEVLAMLSGKYPSELAAELDARITWDRVNDRLSGSRRSRMLAIISGGTIPDRGYYTVNLPDRTRLGELDEEFVHESRVGDVFQLGSTTWRIGAIEHDRVIVTPAPGAPARMPFWHGEFMTRSVALGRRVGELRRLVASMTANEDTLVSVLAERYHCDEHSAHALREYIDEQRSATGVVPDERTIVIEQFRDETASVRIVIHSIFGGRVNAPWGMALARRVTEILGVAVQVQTTDDGIMLRLPNLGGPIPLHALVGLAADEAKRLVLEEVGATSLFGARFRMNAARALLLPRQSPTRRMPLWLQRLKAADLLQTVREFPSFPILVETYRDVLQDAFDMEALAEVLGEIAADRISIRFVETERPSPFAASLQFGFVMDWLYADDSPRAERQATLLSLDRSLLDEVLGTHGPDEDTARAMSEILEKRRTVTAMRGGPARSADELALLLDRAGDLTLAEIDGRVMDEVVWRQESGVVPEGSLSVLLETGRVILVPIAGAKATEWRAILTENYPRYAAAFGSSALSCVRSGCKLLEHRAGIVVPEALLTPVAETLMARREIVARWLSIAGPITISEIRERYDFPSDWIESRLAEWERAGKLVRGRLRHERSSDLLEEPEWCSMRLLELARKRALASLRKQIEPVEIETFAAFLQRWQRVDPRDRLEGPAGLEAAMRQLYGLARPPEAWERDYLPARLGQYEMGWLPQIAASGRLVWAGSARLDPTGSVISLAALRFFERGDGALWMPDETAVPLSDAAVAVQNVLATHGASFLADIGVVMGRTMLSIRDALRELVAAGLVTNDTIEAMREVVRLRPLPNRPRSAAGAGASDPTRWLPADFTRSSSRPIVQRRPNLRRLPRWRRPERSGSGWIGRWSLLRAPGTWGTRPSEEEEEHAGQVARQLLDRYGVVAYDWWRRERPPVTWRAIYKELKSMEYRGEVRRGYFVNGLAGAQFALPNAVEQLRQAREGSSDAPLVVMAASDPVNPYSLQLLGLDRPSLSRPRGHGALLVTRHGRIVLSVEARGKRISVAPGVTQDDASAAVHALGKHLVSGFQHARRRRQPVVETIDGAPVLGSAWMEPFTRAGWRITTAGLEFGV